MMEAYRFMGPDVRGFKLVVMAKSLASARRYVGAQSNSLQHRALRFAGKGLPGTTEGWVAAVARCTITGKEY